MHRRIVSLDYLRGAMAVSVMLYHFVSWSVGTDDGSVLSKLGIYAVSVFYILSGLSLTLAYRDRLQSVPDLWSYVIRRIFRIAPLFWLATSGAILLNLTASLAKQAPLTVDFAKLLSNYSLTFGFFMRDQYYATGAWSIGNEMVFYTLFPLALLFVRKGLRARFFLLITALALLSYFAFSQLTLDMALSDQWNTYINPLNQVPFFLAGMIIAFANIGRKSSWSLLFLGAATVLAFLLVPVPAGRIGMVVNWDRLIFFTLCVVGVYVVYASGLTLRGMLHRTFMFFGETSYAIYLLHPIASAPIVTVASRLGLSTVVTLLVYIVVCIPLTLLAAWMSYRFLEQPAIRLGKQLSSKWSSQRAVSKKSIRGQA